MEWLLVVKVSGICVGYVMICGGKVSDVVRNVVVVSQHKTVVNVSTKYQRGQWCRSLKKMSVN